jgi:hypothetical protein
MMDVQQLVNRQQPIGGVGLAPIGMILDNLSE